MSQPDLRLLRLTLLACGAAWTALPAQSVVSPAHFQLADAPGDLEPAIAWGTYPAQQLQVHDDLVGHAFTVHGIRFRLDGRFPWLAYPSFQIVANAWVSNAATTSTTLAPTYAGNHGPNKLQVLNQHPLTFPATAWQSLPNAFTLDVPFQQPWYFDGTTPLCWEIEVTNCANCTSILCDYVAAPDTNPWPAVIEYGQGCTATGQSWPAQLSLNGSTSWVPPTPTPAMLFLQYGANSLPVGSTGTGLSLIAVALGRLPAPVTLPGTQNCPVYLLPDLLLVMLTQSGGVAGYTTQLPLSPTLNGTSLFSQAAGLDPANNQFVTSNVVQLQLIAPFNQTQVGCLRGPSLSPTVYPGEGSIVEFY